MVNKTEVANSAVNTASRIGPSVFQGMDHLSAWWTGLWGNRRDVELAADPLLILTLIRLADGTLGPAGLIVVTGVKRLSLTLRLLFAEQSQASPLSSLQQ
jgi:hypothetical protein